MAIPKSKRTTTPLSVLVEADTLACYTILICTDEKRFPKRYRWCLTQQIIEASVRAKMHIAKANSVYVNDHESATLRRTYQQEAIADVAVHSTTWPRQPSVSACAMTGRADLSSKSLIAFPTILGLGSAQMWRNTSNLPCLMTSTTLSKSDCTQDFTRGTWMILSSSQMAKSAQQSTAEQSSVSLTKYTYNCIRKNAVSLRPKWASSGLAFGCASSHPGKSLLL